MYSKILFKHIIGNKMDLKSFVTLTFGDMAENHVGMEQIGEMVDEGQGFNLDDLLSVKEKVEAIGCECDINKLELYKKLSEWTSEDEDLEDAYVLIVRDGVNKILSKCSEYNANDMLEEQINLNVDKRAFMYGRVVNKHARWNLCFDDKSREPDYESGKGRIIGYDEVPITKMLYEQFNLYFGEKSKKLKGEGNYYFDTKKCGIGFHGDSERRKVVALRLGENSSPLHFQWFKDSKPVGDRIILNVNGGDIYVMSEKAVGTDWKKKKKYTLRHATGCKKFTEI